MVCLSADSWHCGIQKGTDNGNGTSLMSASITSFSHSVATRKFPQRILCSYLVHECAFERKEI